MLGIKILEKTQIFMLFIEINIKLLFDSEMAQSKASGHLQHTS